MFILYLKKYYQKVRSLCCYETSEHYEIHSIFGQSGRFNAILEQPFWITSKELAAFDAYYRKYRDWLLKQFLYYDFSFNRICTDCFSRREKKNWNIDSFISLYKNSSDEVLFLAQTFEYFSKEAFRDAVNESPSITAHKMRLGALKMLQLIGYEQYDWEISFEEELILERVKTDN